MFCKDKSKIAGDSTSFSSIKHERGSSEDNRIKDKIVKKEKYCGRISLQACNVLNELRCENKLCDGIIVLDDGSQFLIHRAILSASSKYFYALFTNGMKDPNENVIHIPGVDAEIMNCLIEWCYTRRIKITPQNVERLLPTADKYQILGLIDACCEFLNDKMEPENVIGINKFAKNYFCRDLEIASEEYMLKNFENLVASSKELIKMNLEEFYSLLSSDDINIRSEETVFDVAIKWVNYKPEEREKYLTQLFQCVRVGLLERTFFTDKILADPALYSNSHCKHFIKESVRMLYDLDNMDSEEHKERRNYIFRPRSPHEGIVALGGWSDGASTGAMEFYDPRANKWIEIENPIESFYPRAYHGCITIGKLIYVVGGFDGHEYFNTCLVFNISTMKWDEVSHMHSRRCYVSVAYLDNHIYALGGHDGNGRLNTAEKYIIEKNQWKEIHPMHAQRSDASADTLNGKIYICGGFNGQECLDSAEYYDPEINQWTMVYPMQNRRSGLSVAAHNGFIYAIGGFNGVTRMNTGERYDPQTNRWCQIADMYNTRSNFAIEVLEDYVYVIGGFNNITTVAYVECYDTKNNFWLQVSDMNINRSAANATVIKGFKEIKNLIKLKGISNKEEEESG